MAEENFIGLLDNRGLKYFFNKYIKEVYMTQADIDNAIAALVNGAPETLDTLKELADALENNEEVIEALNSSITNKANKATQIIAGEGLSGGGALENNITLKVNTDYISLEEEKKYGIKTSDDGSLYVEVPWTDTNTTYNAATTSAAGLMSAVDKTKLDGVASGATADIAITIAEIDAICDAT